MPRGRGVTTELTPVQRCGPYLVKRDDLFGIAGAFGGKARTCFALAQGAKGLVTAGSRSSPQVNIVAHIAKHLGIPCRVHVPSGQLTPELVESKMLGAELIQHYPGRNSVIIKRASDDAKERGWTLIPFGMQCQEAVEQTRKQVANIPHDVSRIVVPVGSGMTLAGVLYGCLDYGLGNVKVLGVVVGADPSDRLRMYAPFGWRQMVRLVASKLDYGTPYDPGQTWPWFKLDPFYESKAVPFLAPGDCLWVVGIRSTAVDRERSLYHAD